MADRSSRSYRLYVGRGLRADPFAHRRRTEDQLEGSASTCPTWAPNSSKPC